MAKKATSYEASKETSFIPDCSHRPSSRDNQPQSPFSVSARLSMIAYGAVHRPKSTIASLSDEADSAI